MCNPQKAHLQYMAKLFAEGRETIHPRNDIVMLFTRICEQKKQKTNGKTFANFPPTFQLNTEFHRLTSHSLHSFDFRRFHQLVTHCVWGMEPNHQL